MSTPSDNQQPEQPRPWRADDQRDRDAGGHPALHPAPPPMSSPYGAPLSSNESNSGDSSQRQPLRFPRPEGDQVWGQNPPPYAAPSGGGTGGTGTTIPPTAPTGQEWGSRNETFFLPPQFSYNPDQKQPEVAPAPAPKRSRRTMVIAASGAAVVLAGAIAGGVILLSHKGSDNPVAKPTPSANNDKVASDTKTAKPKTSTTPAWSVRVSNPDPVAKTVVGSWVVNDHAVVRADATGLQAYDTETGRGLWIYTTPDPNSPICDVSSSVQGKIAVVRTGPKDNCTTATAIDAESGHVLWTAPIPGGTTTPSAVIGDDTVVASAGNMITVWNAGDGKKLWDLDLGKANPPCRVIQTGVQAASVAVLADCGKGMTVLMKDAHNGADRWQTLLPPDSAPNSHHALLQAAGLTMVHVQATPSGAPPVDAYYPLNDQGQLQPVIFGLGDFGQLEPRVGPKAHELAHLAGNILIEPVAVKNPAVGDPPPAGLVAFDVTSGKVLWKSPALTGAPATIVAANNDRVLVLDPGKANTAPGAQLLQFSTADGTPGASPIKDPLGPDWAGASAAYLVGDRLVLVPALPRKDAAVMAFALKS